MKQAQYATGSGGNCDQITFIFAFLKEATTHFQAVVQKECAFGYVAFS